MHIAFDPPHSHQHHNRPHKKQLCFNHHCVHQYLIYPCTTILYYPQVDCAINHYYHDSEGAWGAFGCDGAWPPGLIMVLGQKINHEFAAYMDWIVNNNYGKIQVKLDFRTTVLISGGQRKL